MSFAAMLHGLRSTHVNCVVVGGLAATAHGSRRVTDDLDICYDASAANIARLADLLAKWKAYPRGIEHGLPFFMDMRQIRATPIMALTSREGFVNVLDTVKGVGAFDQCLKRSKMVEAFGIKIRVLDLSALIRAKRAAGRPKDIGQLPELEALLALLRQQSGQML